MCKYGNNTINFYGTGNLEKNEISEEEKKIVEIVEKKIIKFKNEFLRDPQFKINLNNNIKIVEEIKKTKKFPWYLRDLNLLALGIIAQESRFDNEIVNKRTKAFSIYQFTENVFNKYTKNLDKNKKNEIIKSPIKMINYFISELNFLKNKLNSINNKNGKKIEKALFKNIFDKVGITSQKEKRLFVSYMIVNAYNSGPKRIRVLLKEFTEKYTGKNITTAKALLYKITEFGIDNKDGVLNGYSKESAEYVLKVIAGARAVKQFLKIKSILNKKN